jgi:hypothetical protein
MGGSVFDESPESFEFEFSSSTESLLAFVGSIGIIYS